MNNRFSVKFIGFELAYYPIEVMDNNGVPFAKPRLTSLRVCDAQELINKLQEVIEEAKANENR